jgi:hypothetical protein
MNNRSPIELQNSRGEIILQIFIGRAGIRGRSINSRRHFDTYRQLKHLKELLKGGQINLEEYELIKIELLSR